MDSIEEYDPTLPLDMNSTSINIANLQDQSSIVENSAMSDPVHAQMSSTNLLTLPTGGMSPVSSRTMKDYATQISDLKKENFSLKLRIFYMEERMQQQFEDDYDQVFKTNIELKVECDSLRKDLQDKHELLVKASNAVACLEGGPEEIRKAQELAQRELQQVKNTMNEQVLETDKELRAVRAEADTLAENIHKLQDYAHKLEQDNENLKKDLDRAEAQVETMTADEAKNESIPEQVDLLKEDLQKKERLIEQLRETLEVKQTMVEALSDEKKMEEGNLEKYKEVVENLEDKNTELENELTKRKQQDEKLRSEYTEYLEMEHEYQQHISEQQQRLDEFEIAARQMSEELEKREEEVKDLSEALKDAEDTGKELADKYDNLQKEKDGKKSKELLMRDKAISGLTEVIKKRDEEIVRLKEDVTQRETRLEEITNTITKLNSDEEELDQRLRRLKDLERQVNQLKDLSAELEKKNRNTSTQLGDSEELVRSLDEQLKEKDEKFQGLLTKYKELLEKQRLGDSEELVRSLDEQLKEKDEKLQDLLTKYKELLEKQRLENSKEPVQPLDEQMKEKDEELQDLLNKYKLEKQQLKNSDELVRSLKEQLRERDENLQDLRNKYMELIKKQQLEGSGEAVRSLEEQMREKDTKFQDSHVNYNELTGKQQLEEQVRSIKEQLKEKDEKLQDLSTKYKQLIKKQQLENNEELVRSLDEQLKEKDEKLQDLSTKYKELIKKQQLDNNEELVRSLDEQLKEKDEKLQDLLTKYKELIKKQQLENNEELVRSLDEQLKEKDEKLQDLLTKYKELLKKQQEDELAKIKALKKHEDMAGQFQKEKTEFAEMLNNMKRRFEEQTASSGEKEKEQEILRLQEKLQTVETLLRSKHLQLEEATNFFKTAENDRKAALDELKSAMMRRDKEHCREIDSRNRIDAAKSADIERLREEIRVKDDRIQNLEDEILQLDRATHEARDKAVNSARETARWKEDSARKNSAIQELTKSLEDVGNEASNSEQKQIMKLTRESVELRQLLKAREAELKFLQTEQAADVPYVESLKCEIARKDKIIADERQLQDSLHNAFVTWSQISEDSSSMNLALDALRLELDNHKEELNIARNKIVTLATKLEASNRQLSALRESSDGKDRLIEDLKASQRYPTVESEEGSSTVTENLKLSSSRNQNHHNSRQQRFTKRKSKHRKPVDELSTQSSSTISALDNDDFDFLSSESDFSAAHPGPRIKEELKIEIQSLHKEIDALKGTRKKEANVKDLLQKLELRKEHLRRLTDILTEEQKLYRNQLNLPRLSSHDSHSEFGDGADVARSKRQLDRTLKSVEHVRDKLRSLLLEVTPTEDASIQVCDDMYQSIGSTLFPLNQTSYMDVPVHDRSDHTVVEERENVISELQTELEQTRVKLGDAVRELTGLQAVASDVKQLKDQLGDKQREIQRLQIYLKDLKKQGEVKEAEMSALRIEVDQLRSLRLKVSKESDSEHQTSIYSGEESDGMGSLSRRELRDFISNLKKKLKNAEKLNELLGDQIESARPENPGDSVTVDPNMTQHLSSEIERVKEQLKNAREQLRNAEDQARKSPHGRSSRYPDTEVTKQMPRSKLPIPVEKSSLKTNDSPQQEKEDYGQLKAQCTQLQNKLLATEETVRQQTEKLKKCKAAMVSAGIGDIPLSPIKSAQNGPNSLTGNEFATGGNGTHPNIPQHTRDTSGDTAGARTQTSVDDTGYASVSPKSEEKYNSLIQAQAKELSALRQQLKKARDICKDIKTQYDIVSLYITTLLNTSEGKVDTMLATSVTNELDRCQQITRKLKDQLSEWTSDGSLSTDSDQSVSSRKMSPAQQQATQLLRKSREIEEKNRKIRELEERLANLMNSRQDSQPRFQKVKGQLFLPENLGYLTPTSSHHSVCTDAEKELTSPAFWPTISQNTEYAPLPDHRSPRLSKNLPMSQHNSAVTEYLPGNGDKVHGNIVNIPGGRRLSTTSDSENCTAAYGGSWSTAALPRKQRQWESRRLSLKQNSPVPSSGRDDSEDVDALKRKLKVSKKLNESLKEELDITNETLKQATLPSAHGQVSRNPADVLEEHLNEIRALRRQLEASIETNDRLRAQLERKLRQAGSKSGASEHVSANIYLPAGESDDQKYESQIEGLRRELARANKEIAKLQNQLEAEISMKNNFAAASRELEQLRMRLVESSTQTGMLGNYIDDLNRTVTEKDAKVESLQTKVDSLEDELKQLNDEKEVTGLEKGTLRENAYAATENANRMREDLNRLSEELDESHNLVRSLKSELALYEKFHKNKGLSGDPRSSRGHDNQGWNLDISEFLSEIKILRVQLERSIEANAALRKQLQTQLSYKEKNSTALSPGRLTTINIHHLPPNSPGRHEDDILDERKPDSGRSNNTRRKLKMPRDEKPSSFLMTPPPSASSCGERHSLAGFDFAPIPTHGPVTSSNRKQPNAQRPYYDLHGLYVLGKVNDFNELKQTLADGRLLIRNLDLRPTGKVVSSYVSPARTSPRRMRSNDLEENLRLLLKMLENSGRILKLFWPASIPPPSLYFPLSEDSEKVCLKCSSRQSDASSDVSKCTKDAGFASDSSINSEADGLRREVGKLHKKLSTQDKLLQSTVDRLQTANRLKEGIEHAILRQLTVTHDVLKRARGNLEAKADETSPKERQLPSS